MNMQTICRLNMKKKKSSNSCVSVVLQNVDKATSFRWYEMKRMIFSGSKERETNRFVALSVILRRLSSTFFTWSYTMLTKMRQTKTNTYVEIGANNIRTVLCIFSFIHRFGVWFSFSHKHRHTYIHYLHSSNVSPNSSVSLRSCFVILVSWIRLRVWKEMREIERERLTQFLTKDAAKTCMRTQMI